MEENLNIDPDRARILASDLENCANHAISAGGAVAIANSAESNEGTHELISAVRSAVTSINERHAQLLSDINTIVEKSRMSIQAIEETDYSNAAAVSPR